MTANASARPILLTKTHLWGSRQTRRHLVLWARYIKMTAGRKIKLQQRFYATAPGMMGRYFYSTLPSRRLFSLLWYRPYITHYLDQHDNEAGSFSTRCCICKVDSNLTHYTHTTYSHTHKHVCVCVCITLSTNPTQSALQSVLRS